VDNIKTTNIMDNIKTTNTVGNIEINPKKIGSEHGDGRNPLMIMSFCIQY
jgi:hypothetical protein